MNLPNFLIISPPKTGTTSLYYYLGQHPSIFISPVKEPGFFINEPGKFVEKTIKHSLTNTITSLEEYKKLFSGIKNETAYGEASTHYFYDLNAAERIHALIPDIKIITILRNPVERAFSDYLMFYGLLETEPCKDFQEAILAELEQPESNILEGEKRRYIEAGLYHKHLSRYFRWFDEDQIKVFLFEDFRMNSRAVVKETYQFLGVDPNFIPETKLEYNKSGLPKNQLLHDLLTKPNIITNSLRVMIPEWMKARMLSFAQNINYSKPKISKDAVEFLIDIFREDLIKLQKILNKDLSDWFNVH